MYIPCPHCGEEITEDSDFCPHCGTLFEAAGKPMCETHPSAPAVGVCVICQKLLCRSCAKHAGGRMFCQDHRTVKVQQDWAEIVRSSDMNEAELVRAVLEKAGFKVQKQNFDSIGFAWDGGGDSPQSRSNLSRPAIVLVPIPEYLKARAAIDEWEASAVPKEGTSAGEEGTDDPGETRGAPGSGDRDAGPGQADKQT
jgi:hypothetical protein